MDNTKRDVEEILLFYPDKIAEHEKSIMQIIDQLEVDGKHRKQIESRVELEVLSDSKNVEEHFHLSNAALRKAEGLKRLQENEDYEEILGEIAGNRHRLKTFEIELSRLKRVFRAAESLVRL